VVWCGAFGENRSARGVTVALLEAHLPSHSNLVVLWNAVLFGANVTFCVETMPSLDPSPGGRIRAIGLKQSLFSPPSDKLK